MFVYLLLSEIISQPFKMMSFCISYNLLNYPEMQYGDTVQE